MTDYITELDVVDPKIAAMRAWVRCEECDSGGEAMDMVHQYDGAWLCPSCDDGFRRDYEDQQRYLSQVLTTRHHL